LPPLQVSPQPQLPQAPPHPSSPHSFAAQDAEHLHVPFEQ